MPTQTRKVEENPGLQSLESDDILVCFPNGSTVKLSLSDCLNDSVGKEDASSSSMPMKRKRSESDAEQYVWESASVLSTQSTQSSISDLSTSDTSDDAGEEAQDSNKKKRPGLYEMYRQMGNLKESSTSAPSDSNKEKGHDLNERYNRMCTSQFQSKVKGVGFNVQSKKWIGSCTVKGFCTYLGSYESREDAELVMTRFREILPQYVPKSDISRLGNEYKPQFQAAKRAAIESSLSLPLRDSRNIIFEQSSDTSDSETDRQRRNPTDSSTTISSDAPIPKSKVSGVTFNSHEKKWDAQCTIKGIFTYFGSYESRDDAERIIFEFRNILPQYVPLVITEWISDLGDEHKLLFDAARKAAIVNTLSIKDTQLSFSDLSDINTSDESQEKIPDSNKEKGQDLHGRERQMCILKESSTSAPSDESNKEKGPGLYEMYKQICSPPKSSTNPQSKVSGVTFDARTKKWIAACTVKRLKKHLGSYESRDDAERVTKRFREILHQYVPLEKEASELRNEYKQNFDAAKCAAIKSVASEKPFCRSMFRYF